MALVPIYIGEDHYVTWTGANDAADDTALNAALVTYSLEDEDGTVVTGGTGSLAYVSSSSGNYRGIIENTVTELLTDGEVYNLDVTFNQGAYDGFRRLTLLAQYRGSE